MTKQASLHFLQCFGLGETSKIANGTAGYQVLNECIVHIGRAERLGWWEKVIQENIPGCETLEDFALLEPTLETIQNLSLSLSALVSNDRLKNVQSVSADKQDKQYENTIRRSQYFLLYEETAHAIRSGDVGRVETCLRDWIPIFKAVGKHKYAAYAAAVPNRRALCLSCTIKVLLLILNRVTNSPNLLIQRKSIRYNWFCNISGKEMKYQGNDWLVELNNMLTKVNNYLLWLLMLLTIVLSPRREFMAVMGRITLSIA